MIEIFRLKADGEAQELEPLPGDKVQVRVSCQGDLAVMPFFPTDDCDTGWLVIHEAGEQGEPGGDLPDHLMGPRRLDQHEGVLIGARDARSLDVIIEALSAIRERLEPKAPFKTTTELALEKMERTGGIPSAPERKGVPWGKVTQ